MDLLAQLNAANEKVTSLTDDKTKLASDLQAANSQIKILTESISTLTTERDDAVTARGLAETALQDEQTNHVTALKTKDDRITVLELSEKTLKADAKTAEQLALERTGKGGNKPAKGNAEGAMTRADALAEYGKLKDPKTRAEFYETNKAIMFPKK